MKKMKKKQGRKNKRMVLTKALKNEEEREGEGGEGGEEE